MDFPGPNQRGARTSTTPSNGMENDQIVPQRSNHVSSVMLYGIPIVSLYIEGQERLCLAQISNTLLKQFSYNEIHNRRVALGITCVQCTPVQLEILRRAGAMPVSSRRCGMITRREAERLCKSFLGDNSPPRLPDDFAFNVQHKCAWGCRGSFLPSRYNSSRAKCIKCTYCGMFFSPNKFIFHSHRITTNDRYVQPDAANFNSWRRHMMLSGHPHEEVTHAWEDVKAMFNGGTRKRLVSGHSHNNGNQNRSSPSSAATIAGIVEGNSCSSPADSESEAKLASHIVCEDSTCSKRSSDHQYNYSHVAAAAAVVGVTAVAAATVGVPFNLHRSSVLSPLQPQHDLSIMPLSRNFVVDYMWQQQQQHQHNSKKASESAQGFESCPIPWVRHNQEISGASSMRLMHQPTFNVKNETHAAICGVFSKNRKLPPTEQLISNTNGKISELELPDGNIPSILSSSAFKPVVASAAIVSTSLYATHSSNSSSSSNVYISPAQSTRTTTVLTQSSLNRLPLPSILEPMQSLENDRLDYAAFESTHLSSVLINKANSNKSISSDNSSIHDLEDDDDDEVVDIETTEDEAPVLTINETLDVCPYPAPAELSSSSQSPSHSESPNDIDVDGFTTDAEEQFDLKSDIKSYDNKIGRSFFKVFSNEKLSSSGKVMEKNVENEKCSKVLATTSESKSNEDTNGISIHLRNLSRRKCATQSKNRPLSKRTAASSKVLNEKLITQVVTSSKPNLHIQQHVTFPVFLKPHVRHHHHRQLSPNTLADSSSKWSYPMGNIRQFYCYETTENGLDLN